MTGGHQTIALERHERQVDAPPTLRAVSRGGECDLDRDVYGLLGIPVDAIAMDNVIARLNAAAERGRPLLMSTPNLNFLVLSQSDEAFRDVLGDSDLCPPDGVPILWLAQLLNAPIRRRIAGSEIFDVLRRTPSARPIRVFLFGGAPGVADIVAEKINAVPGGLHCVGHFAPGFGTVEEMSSAAIIDRINASGADFVAVFLNAAKGQAWLRRNKDRLKAPIRAQLGATVNFQAGTARRAPPVFQRLGIEWLWRIKEEPWLWQRYARDGFALLHLLFTAVLPLVLLRLAGDEKKSIAFEPIAEAGRQTIALRGAATRANEEPLRAAFRAVAEKGQDVMLDLSGTTSVDARFFGLLLALRKTLAARGRRLQMRAPSRKVAWQFHLNRFGYLLAS